MFNHLEARAASEGGKQAICLSASQMQARNVDKNRGVGQRRDYALMRCWGSIRTEHVMHGLKEGGGKERAHFVNNL